MVLAVDEVPHFLEQPHMGMLAHLPGGRMDIRRCTVCGTPNADHVALREVARVWVKHHFWALINKLGRA